ncbi:DddA-like double-stranded DNA deaminase toxin [Streptomyces sp. bgisy082]|uniref:DddA-like double-stranded DNA deaminase toxin n=1 Tax=Streptomyces sp. bgisy082 TaxID=3413776 RepID=UPI003D72D451
MQPRPRETASYSCEHAETKLAILMRNHGVKEYSVTVKNKYVRDVTSPGMGCLRTVAATLLRGWKTKIYYPEKGSPETIFGISDVPLEWKKR